METDNLSDIICRNSKIFIESAVTFRNESFKTQHILSTSFSIKRAISPIVQEHSTNVQNDCIKPTKKSLKFIEYRSSDISNRLFPLLMKNLFLCNISHYPKQDWLLPIQNRLAISKVLWMKVALHLRYLLHLLILLL